MLQFMFLNHPLGIFLSVKRVKVIEEIFETERKYLSCLDTVDKVSSPCCLFSSK